MRDHCYGLDFFEQFLEDLIVAIEFLKGILCPDCHTETVNQVYRENPDGGYDEVGFKCHKCKKMF